jgi:hypothetical protein
MMPPYPANSHWHAIPEPVRLNRFDEQRHTIAASCPAGRSPNAGLPRVKWEEDAAEAEEEASVASPTDEEAADDTGAASAR